MKTTLTLNNARITNVEDLMIVKNQEFNLRLDLEGQSYTDLEWYTNNDPVLSMSVAENKLQADVKALEVGTSNLVITAADFKVAKTLKLTIVDSIPVEADTLGTQVEEPVLK
jgi:hypothetical protein